MRKSKHPSQTKYSSSFFPQIDPKQHSHTSSLFLTAKSSFNPPSIPSFKETVSQKILTPQTSFSWKNTTTAFQKSHFLDDKVLTDKLILDLNPTKKRNLSEIRKKKEDYNNTFNSDKKIKGFRFKPERKRITDICDFTINDSISENYMKTIMTNTDKGSEIHCEDENYFKGLHSKCKIKTMFVIQNPSFGGTSIDKFIERKKLLYKNEDENLKTNKKLFLFVDATIFDKENSQTNLLYCFLDVYMKIEYFDEIKKMLSNKFKLNVRNIFLYQRNGNNILSIKDIPWNENTILVYNSPQFKGLPIDSSKIKLFENLDKLEEILVKSSFQSSNMQASEYMMQSFDLESTKDIRLSEENIKFNKNIIERSSAEYLENLLNQTNQTINNNIEKLPELCEKDTNRKSIISSEDYEEYNKIYKIYKKDLKKMRYDYEEVLGSDHENEPQMEDFEKIVEDLDILLQRWKNEPETIKVPDIPDKLWPFYKDRNKMFDKKNLLFQNKRKFTSKKRVLQLLSKKNREIFIQNIPKLMKQTNFSRNELHSTYILYKVLQDVTSQQYKQYDLKSGLNYDTFRNGIYQMYVQSELIAQKIFNNIDSASSGFLNWEKFLRLMEIIKAKTQDEKIDLFIKIADEDGNGSLSKDEVLHLCKICLSKYINEANDPGFFNELTEYFTKLIFLVCNIDIKEEIPMLKIKETIISGNIESDLLCMFCGADM